MSFATFAGMHTNEDWSSEEARAVAAAAPGGDEDEIVQELPIVLNQELAHTLYLMQSPLRPPHRPYDSELGARISMQVKPIQKKVEMQYRLEEAGVMYQHGAPVGHGIKSEHGTGENFDVDHEYAHVRNLTLQGKNVQPKTNYCAGVLSNGVLHLTPISAVVRFKPQLQYIDEAEAAAAANAEVAKEAHRAERMLSGRMTEEEELEVEEEMYQKAKEEEGKKALQTVVMKVDRKKGGAAGAAGAPGGPGVGPGGVMRKQTYAYIKQLEESEKWIPLKLHEQDSQPSAQQYHRLLSSVSPPAIPFNVAAQHYLSYVNPPDPLENSERSMVATGDPLHLNFEERLLHFMRNARVIHMRELCTKMQIGTVQAVEAAVRLMADMCWIVQGCWVLKSSIAFDRSWRPGMPVPPATAAPTSAYAHPASAVSSASSRGTRPLAQRIQLARDLLCIEFSRSRVLFRDEVNQVLQLELEELDALLDEVATCVPVSEGQKERQGMAPKAQWEWKLQTDLTLQQYYPKVVAQVLQQFPPLEAELRALLACTNPHPSRDQASRGLQLPHTNAIVHNQVPAGLTVHRKKPNETFTPTPGAHKQAATVPVPMYEDLASFPPPPMMPASGFDDDGAFPPPPPAGADFDFPPPPAEGAAAGADFDFPPPPEFAMPAPVAAAAMPAPAAAADDPASAAAAVPSDTAAAASVSAPVAAASLSDEQTSLAWDAHLSSLFSTHGVLQSDFVLQQLALVGAQAASPSTAAVLLHQSLEARTTRFGPQLAWRMLSVQQGGGGSKAGQAHRQALSALFADSDSVGTAAMRAALPRSLSDDRRRELMKEFAVYDSSAHTWKLKPGHP